MQRCFAFLAALVVAVLVICPVGASAATPLGAVVSNGTVQLGVTQWGDLNYDCAAAADTDCPAPSAVGSTSAVGLRYVALNTEATADGCPCEGWGVADAASGLTGYANEASGNLNITAVGSVATATSVVVTTDVSDPAIPDYSLRVVHDYHPSTISPNLYEATVSITNTGTQDVTDLRYRRVMDWDIEPTAFQEWVTIANTGASRQLQFDSDQGFDSSDPLSARDYGMAESACGTGYTGRCNFTDLGSGAQYPDVTTPADHGSLFDFGFGALAPGQTRIFQTYYGAAPSEEVALSAIAAQGIGAYSLGEPDCGNNGNFGGLCTDVAPLGGVLAGQPNTFTFGFLTADADLSVAAGAAPAAVVTGSQSSASFTETNNGPDATPDARLTIALPDGADFVSALPSQGTCANTDAGVVCSFGALHSGDSATVVVKTTLTKAGSHTLTATTSTPANDSDAANNEASVALAASDVIVTVLPALPGAAGAPAAPFQVQVQFRLPRACATPCKASAQLMLRDGTSTLGSRSELSLVGRGHVRFNVPVDKAALQAAAGVVDAKGYRTTSTRMVVRTLGANGRWARVVKLGHITVALGRLASGAAPRAAGKVF